MNYVYIITSVADRRVRYVGFTTNLRTRLAAHNAGQNQSTVRARPWCLVSYFAFAEPAKAIAFERYLKCGSGKTFAQRHSI